MRKSIAALSALLAVSGCVLTPAQLLDEGDRSELALKLPPAQAAGCMARNAENAGAGFRASVRALPRPDNYEVLLRIAQDTITYGTFGLVLIEPASTGSRATMYRHPAGATSSVFDDMPKGC